MAPSPASRILLVGLLAAVAGPLSAQREAVSRITANPAQVQIAVGDTATSDIVLEAKKGGTLDPAKRRDLKARAEDPETVRSEIKDGHLLMTALRRGQTLIKIVAGDATGWVSVEVEAQRAVTPAAAPAAPPPPAVADLLRSDTAITLLPGETWHLQVTPVGPDRNPVPATLRFKSFGLEVASLNDSAPGDVTARAPGKTGIGIEVPGSPVATLVSVEVSGEPVVLDVDTLFLSGQGGDTLRVVAPALGGRRYRGKVLFSSSNPAVADVETATGMVRAVAPGEADIRVDLPGAGRELLGKVRVLPQAAAVTPPALVGVALTVPMRATRRVILAANSSLDGSDTLYAIPANWQVADTTIATYDPVRGLLSGRHVGSTTLSARPVLHGIKLAADSYQWDVRVMGGGVTAGPARRGIRVGQRDSLRAFVRDSTGHPTDIHADLRWTSSDPQVIRELGHGLIEAVSPGRSTLVGRAEWDSAATVTAFVSPDLVFSAGGVSDGKSFSRLYGFDFHTHTARALKDNDGIDTDPAVSPDRTRLAFVRSVSGSQAIWVADADGDSARRVTPDNLRGSAPEWSHDGRWIYFLSGREKAPPRVFAVELATGQLRPVTDSVSPIQDFALSPDGKWLFWAMVRRDQLDLVAARLDSVGSITPTTWSIFNTPQDEMIPRFAAGTGDLYFIRRQRSGRNSVTLMRFPMSATVPEEVTHMPDGFVAYAVSPDGSKIVVVAPREDPRSKRIRKAVYLLEPRGGAPPGMTLLYDDLNADTGAPSFAP